jgi:hypothetical protein
MATQGFQTYNRFKQGIKELKQLYDLTYHLYIQEHERIEVLLPDSKPMVTITTKVGVANHSLHSLLLKTQKRYPDKLRQLILVSSITTLEVYLTDLIGEIFKRDITPFEEQTPIEFMKSQALNFPSITDMQSEIINRDMRRLTSGGLADMRKYYLSKFKIDFGKFEVSINEIEEIHIRRHLHVHRNGICDKEYANKYPKMDFFAGDRINISHDYIIDSLNKLLEFASEINKEVVFKYPDYSKGFSYYHNGISINQKVPHQKLMLEFRLKNKSFNIEKYLKEFRTKKHKLIDYIAQISIKDRTCILIIIGEQPILSKFFKGLVSKNEFDLKHTIELKI